MTNMKFDKTLFDLASAEGQVSFGQAMAQYGRVMASVYGMTMFM